MKKAIILLATLAALTGFSAKASITNVVAWGDYANVDCYLYTWTPLDSTLTMYSDQYGQGSVSGKVQTDTPDDPSLTLANTINNDTVFAWTSYNVDVFMNQSFSILSPTLIGPIYSAGDWAVQSYTPTATWNGSQWVGHLVLGGATPIPVAGVLSFSYTINFLGSVNFTEVLTPVPEPNTLSLLFSGVSLLGGFTALRARRKRS
jgi:hypothetical protein